MRRLRTVLAIVRPHPDQKLRRAFDRGRRRLVFPDVRRPPQRIQRIAALLGSALALFVSGCAGTDEGPAAAPATTAVHSGVPAAAPTDPEPPPPPSVTVTSASATTAPPAAEAVAIDPPAEPRLASHLFVPVGASRSIAGLGELLEVIAIDGASVAVEGDTVTAIAPGVSCLRFRYRDVPGENDVQTSCVAAFDETGDCSGMEPLRLDLNTFLDAPGAPVGDADAFAGGDLYSSCTTPDGHYRLQRPATELPQLYFAIVDALGAGAYSLGDDEFAAQRNGVVTTYDDSQLRLPWMVTVSREVADIRWMADGTFAINSEDCSRVPSCTDDPSVVVPGDVFRPSLGLGPDQLQAVMDATQPAQLEGFVNDRIGIPWADIAAVHPDATLQAFSRLVVLELMGDLLEEWDAAYGLREKGLVIGYWQPWFVERRLSGYCFPDGDERAACESIEAAISAYEGERLAAWRDSGLRLWQAGFIGVDGRFPLDERRPHWSAFEGVLAGIGDQQLPEMNLRSAYGDAVRDLAVDVGETTPVMLVLTGGPITAQTTGVFCEADICPSDFTLAYDMAEGALAAGMSVFSREQFRGFGVATFEGSHFDIREPYEDYGYPLNRVGETGYNHPILNIWRAS
ncbi:MAG: hypothetical protein ACE5GC_07985 [Acidimicrobiia bacterium]